MADDTPESVKEQASTLVPKIAARAENIEAILGQGVVAARAMRDMAPSIGTALSVTPAEALPLEQWRRQRDGLLAWYDAAGEFEAQARTMANTLTVHTSAIASTSTSTLQIISKIPLPLTDAGRFELAHTTFRTVVEQIPAFESVRTSMERLGLDTRLLKHAQGAFARPVEGDGGSVSILIALRECIEGSVNELIQRRPRQEPANKMLAKIITLGAQCGRQWYAAAHFARLGTEAAELMTDLSKTKQLDMTREELRDEYSRALLLFSSILDSLDEQRFRPG